MVLGSSVKMQIKKPTDAGTSIGGFETISIHRL